jgi:hypothetical protein
MPENPTTNFASWAAQSAPYLGVVPGGSFLAPLAAMYGAVSSGAKPQSRKLPEPQDQSDTQIGAEKDYGPNIGTKVYTGPRYGYQTIDTAQTMNPEQAATDPTGQGEFRRVQQVLRERFAPPAKPEAKRPVDADTRTPETATTTGVQGQGGATQTTDPQTDKYQQFIERLITDPKLRAEFAEQDLQNYVRRALITEALGARSRRELTKREVELKNIDAWRALEQTRLQTNAQQAIAFGSTVAASMVPNQGLGQVLNQAYASAMAPFTSFTLK